MAKFSVDRLMRRAKTSELKGAKDDARAVYRAILDRFPNNTRAAQALQALDTAPGNTKNVAGLKAEVEELITLQQQGKFDLAAEKAESLTARFPASSDLWSRLAAASHRIGRFDRMEFALRKACELSPDDANLRCNLGVALYLQSKNEEAIAVFQAALNSKPDYAEAFNNMAAAQKNLGKLEDAAENYSKATQIRPDYAEAYNNKGVILSELGRHEDAVASLQNALKINPEFLDAYKNLGVALAGLGQSEAAETAFRRALEISPGFVEAHSSLGNLLSVQGRSAEALACFDEALRLSPGYAPALFNKGIALRNEGKPGEAIESYLEAARLQPDSPQIQVNLGVAYQAIDKLDEAVACYDRALALDPDIPEPHANKGELFSRMRQEVDAVRSYEAALRIDPSNDAVRIQKLHQQAHIADWRAYSEFAEFGETLGTGNVAIAPFTALPFEDNPKRQLVRSQRFANQVRKIAEPPLPASIKNPDERLRVGYFSADFRDHPMPLVMIGYFEACNRDRFETFVFAFGPKADSMIRDRTKLAVEHFIDVGQMDDQSIVDLARENQIDIAIDLMGFTKNAKPELFARRLAPVQINFLGFPGSMGAEFIDYIIGDPVLIPEHEKQNYSEQVLEMPNSYFPYDQAQEIAQTSTTRADFGLPEDGFVFCCFNQVYKIGPSEFDIWMRLLGKVDGSVLWLPNSSSSAVENLGNEAKLRGIDPARLIFTERVAHEKHLARHKHADLFIDTFNYNAHTTGVDALWTGLPVVTKAGKQFSARVGASLLSAVGLPELITESDADYEQLILDLATDPERLSRLRTRLAQNRLTKPLFDTQAYTRDFEASLESVFEKSQREASAP